MTIPYSSLGALALAICLPLCLQACSSPPEIRTASSAHQALPAGVSCPRPQTRFPMYDRDTRDAFWDIHRNGGTTIYCSAQFDGKARRTTRSALPVNIEHAVPQAQMKGIDGAGGDLHNLWPAILEVNTARQHWRLVDDIPGETGLFANRSEPELAACDFELQEDGDEAVIEPAPSARGPLARAILHMSLAYPAIRTRTAEFAQFLAWHAAHPVSEEERRRNDEIELVTGMRNAFVDFPEWGDAIVKACR